MKTTSKFISLFALLALARINVSVASIVTSNNLSSASLNSGNPLTAAGAAASLSFSTTPGTLNAVTATVQTVGNFPFTYNAPGISVISSSSDGSSPIAGYPTSGTIFLAGGAPYGPVNVATTFSVPSAASNLHYVLGYDVGFQYGNSTWTSSNITQYTPAGADSGLVTGYGGNLIPNASFENTSLNFFQKSGSIVLGAGVAGSNVFQNTGTQSAFLAIPLTLGNSYALDFWYQGTQAKIEYGYSPIPDGYAVGSGNTSILSNTGVWTEETYTFTATSSILYLGGMSNGGALNLDSVYLGTETITVPEPSTFAMTLVISGVFAVHLLRLRRRV